MTRASPSASALEERVNGVMQAGIDRIPRRMGYRGLEDRSDALDSKPLVETGQWGCSCSARIIERTGVEGKRESN
jgi:hypothetical protein